jgi:hypothetical protein
VLEILVDGNPTTQISGAAFFKHKYLTNLPVTPEDLVITAADNLTQVLKTSIPQHLQVSTIQVWVRGRTL